MASLWEQLMGGYLSPLSLFQTPSLGATFVQPLTPPKPIIPQNNLGTAPLGQAQGGLGSTPKRAPAGPGTGGVGIGGAGQYGQANLGQAPQNGASFTRAQQRGLQRNAQYSSPPSGTSVQGGFGTQYGTSYGNIAPSLTGGMAEDVFGQPILNPVNNMPVPNAPQAYTTNPQTGQQEFLYDQNGSPIASTITNFQATAGGLSSEELKASGYTQFGGTWIYNPEGGVQQAQNNLPWWQKEGFESEKKANQYYTKKKRAEKKYAEANDPRKNRRKREKAKMGSGGVTTATSFMGTG